MAVQAQSTEIREAALRPILRPGEYFWPIAALLSILVLWGMVAYFFQLRDGLIVTGLGPMMGGLRRAIYDRLALKWQGTPQQRRILEWGMTVVAIVIIPLAVSVHSVLAWLFGVTARPGWDSTIFGPY